MRRCPIAASASFSIRSNKAGFKNLALLVGNGSTMIPLELPDPNEPIKGSVQSDRHDPR